MVNPAIPTGSYGNKTFWAVWSLVNYIITYDNLNGTTAPSPATYTIESLPVTLGNPSGTYIGYVFSGWKVDNALGANAPVPAVPTGSTGNKTFWATWVSDTSAIVYNNLNGATNSNPSTYVNGVGLVSLTDPGARTGYEFTGWRVNNAIGSPVDTPVIAAGSTGTKTFWATWDPIQYTINYLLNEGVDNKLVKNSNPLAYTIEDSDIKLAGFTLIEGYKFIGWSIDEDGHDIVTGVAIPTGSSGSRTLYAQWEATNTFWVYWKDSITNKIIQKLLFAEGDTISKSQELYYFNPPENNDNKGFKFVEWDGWGEDTIITIEGTMTFITRWEPKVDWQLSSKDVLLGAVLLGVVMLLAIVIFLFAWRSRKEESKPLNEEWDALTAIETTAVKVSETTPPEGTQS